MKPRPLARSVIAAILGASLLATPRPALSKDDDDYLTVEELRAVEAFVGLLADTLEAAERRARLRPPALGTKDDNGQSKGKALVDSNEPVKDEQPTEDSGALDKDAVEFQAPLGTKTRFSAPNGTIKAIALATLGTLVISDLTQATIIMATGRGEFRPTVVQIIDAVRGKQAAAPPRPETETQEAKAPPGTATGMSRFARQAAARRSATNGAAHAAAGRQHAARRPAARNAVRQVGRR